MTRTIFKPPLFLYEKFIKKQKEGIPFVIFLFFLIIFVFARLWVYLAIKKIVPDSIIPNINGVHIHHFAYGILITSVVCYLSLTLPERIINKWRVKLAIFFGVGLGLTFDEFGMWLKLEDEYIIRQGYDAVVILSVIFINLIYLGNFWKKLGKKVFKKSSTA